MKRILVVDDEERIADITTKFLTMNGFDVHKAIGGEEAIKILSTDEQFDLMVLDMKMPRVNGLGVVQKKAELGKKFPVLLLTGSIDAEKYLDSLKDKGFRAGDILYKPIDLSELLEKVKKRLHIA
ncbi:MAG: response regulator transcription factor [Candidatus Omnitrophica bacterium]|nr:response regulator transcription factor [Candidatus Omnitrophota bacterium]